jgi:hypothetical protein
MKLARNERRLHGDYQGVESLAPSDEWANLLVFRGCKRVCQS